MTRRIGAVAMGLLAAVVASCSSTEGGITSTTGGSASSTAAPDTAALETQVRAYSTAFLAGDGNAAYELMSQRCKERTTRPNFVSLVQQAAKLYGPQEIKSLKVDQASGDLARVTYTYDKAELDQRGEPWVRESGVWRIDDCS